MSDKMKGFIHFAARRYLIKAGHISDKTQTIPPKERRNPDPSVYLLYQERTILFMLESWGSIPLSKPSFLRERRRMENPSVMGVLANEGKSSS